MNRRALTAVVLLWCLTAAMVFGTALPHHHHHEHGALDPDSHCAACVWLLHSTTDVPVVFIPLHRSTVECLVAVCNPVLQTAEFATSTPARAPPAALA